MADVVEIKTASDVHILVVDDEPTIREGLTRALNLMGYCAHPAPSGHAALAQLSSTSCDLMVLDMQMPEMDGLEVMRRARQLQPYLLIIVLTGHGALENAMSAIQLGAADYLLKPTSNRAIASAIEMALRTHAEQVRQAQLLRLIGEAAHALRPTPAPAWSPTLSDDRLWRCGPFTLDRRKRLLALDGPSPRTLSLTEGEALILGALMECPDQAQTCRQLARAAWEYDLDEREAQSLVRPHISRLRQKLEADPEHPRFVHTVRGCGYLLSIPQKAAPKFAAE